MRSGEPLTARVTLVNAGSVAGEEVAQVYLSDLKASVPVPLHSLVAFKRVALQPGERRELEFTIAAEAMQLVDDEGSAVLEPGEFVVTIGGCAPGARGQALGAPNPVSALFRVQ